MKKTLVAAALLSLVAPAARGDEAAATFQAKCAVCHGKDGKGQNPMGQKLGVKDLTVTKLSQADVEKTITDGKGKMTGFKGKLSDAEIKAMASFVKGGLK
ncbi:MAG TPA: c-type cytochrome [Anaeromyxobacteraceae bacterium]|nr:c-type cytochrome [Anaeromyxobacteraceae bacterium]